MGHDQLLGLLFYIKSGLKKLNYFILNVALKCDYIKWLMALTSDNYKQLLLQWRIKNLWLSVSEKFNLMKQSNIHYFESSFFVKPFKTTHSFVYYFRVKKVQ